MNEEFAITLKTILDESSLTAVKTKLQGFAETVSEQLVKIKVDTGAKRIVAPDTDKDLQETNTQLAEMERRLSEILARMHEIETFAPNKVFGDYTIPDEMWEEYDRLQEEAIQLQDEIEKMKNDMGEMTHSTGKIADDLKDSRDAIKDAKEDNDSWGLSLFNLKKTLKQVVFGMLGIRSVYSVLRQAMSAYLAQNDALKQKIDSLKYTLGSLVGPIVQWIVNMFYVLTQYVDYILKAFGFAGLEMKAVSSGAGTTAKNLKKAKEEAKQLAGFDELNNLSKTEDIDEDVGSGGGGAGAGSVWDDTFAQKIKDNIAEISAYISEALLFLGAVLLFSGANIPLGLGLIALGAVNLAGQIVANWNGMSEKLGSVLSGILTTLATMALVFGVLMVLFSPVNLGLGIALIAVGAVAMATAVAIDMKFTEDKVGSALRKIAEIVGGAMIAIGAIMVISGAMIGLGLAMIAGGIALTAFSVDWNSSESKVNEVANKIAGIGGVLLFALGAIFLATGNLPLGIGLIIAGAGAIGVSQRKVDWESTASTIKEKFKPVGEFFSDLTGTISGYFSKLFVKDGNTSVSYASKQGAKNIQSFFKGDNSLSTFFKEKTEQIGNKFRTLFSGTGSSSVSYASKQGAKNIKDAFRGENRLSTWFEKNSTTGIKGKFAKLFGTGNDSVGKEARTGAKNIKDAFRGERRLSDWFKANVGNELVKIAGETGKGATTQLSSIKGNISVSYGLPSPRSVEDIINRNYGGTITCDINVPTPTWTDSGWRITGQQKLQIQQAQSTRSGNKMMAYDVGTNYVPNDQLAFLHKGEAVVPSEYNRQGKPYVDGSDETNDLIRQFMNMVQTKEFRTYISQNEIGKSSVNYIKQQNRIMGGSII